MRQLSSAAPPLHIHIERLSVDAALLDGARPQLLQQALAAELQRLFADPRLASALATGGALPSLALPPLASAAGATPVALGRQVAAALHRGLSQAQAAPVSHRGEVV